MNAQNKLTTIYIVRHGETQANFDKVVAGHFDSPLTPAGEKQAMERAATLKHIHFDAIFSSDLIRAKRTAELIAADRKLATNTIRLIRERFFGHWEGKPEKIFQEENKELFELKNKLLEEQKRNFKYSYEYESDNDIAARMFLFLREIAVVFAGKTVLVVSHGSIMRGMLMHLGYATTGELPAGSIENTGYVVLESDGVDFFIKETKGVNKQTA